MSRISQMSPEFFKLRNTGHQKLYFLLTLTNTNPKTKYL